MGVAGLWPLLEPAQSVTTLTALSLTKFDTPSRGFRIGIDASIWFFHAEYGKEGENPELRTLFFRCAQLLSQGFLPLFIFDGPLRPDVKRGKRINKSANKLVTGMQAIIEAFGFEYRTAPGEAEAELAFLNRIGVIDGILSDDVDNFLFGAHTVIRNHSSTHAGAKSAIEKAKVIMYTLPHPSLSGISREDLIFIALCSGGDYGTGLDNCGVKIAYGLVRAGFGKSLCKAAQTHAENSSELRAFIRQWKVQLAQELKTNASGFLPRKSPTLAKNIPEAFPDMKILRAYLIPVTSETLGRSDRYDDLLVNNGGQDGWLKKDPSLPRLAEKCEFYFEWGFMESIIKRFRTVIFHGVALRIMRRALLQQQADNANPNTIPLDIIHSHFCSGEYTIEKHDPLNAPLIRDISKTRNHQSTSKTLEYRVCVNPAVLVQLTSCGVKGIRRPDDENEWADFENEFSDDSHLASSDDEGGKKSKQKKEYPDPTLPLKLWLPAVLVKGAVPGVVEAYEEAVRRKQEKKAGKGRKTKPTNLAAKATSSSKSKAKPQSPSRSVDTAGSVAKPTSKISPPLIDPTSSDEDFDYDKRLFVRPAFSARDTSPDSSIPPLSSSSRINSSSNPSANSISTTARTNTMKSHFISTPKKKNGYRSFPVNESSSPKKMAPQPFPMKLEESEDDKSDDPFNSRASPVPPGPPQTPSPQKKTRKAGVITSSDESSGSENNCSPPRALEKSPRKSKDHTYPKDLNGHGDRVRKTIRDVQHPSRAARAARAASPTPLKRSPAKSISAMNPPPARILTAPRQAVVNFASAPAKGPIIISDSEDDSEDDDDASLPPRPIPLRKSPAEQESKLKPKIVPPNRKFGASRDIVNTFDVDDDIPPLLRAQARARAKQVGVGQPGAKVKTTTKVVDVIELSD